MGEGGREVGREGGREGLTEGGRMTYLRSHSRIDARLRQFIHCVISARLPAAKKYVLMFWCSACHHSEETCHHGGPCSQSVITATRHVIKEDHVVSLSSHMDNVV